MVSNASQGTNYGFGYGEACFVEVEEGAEFAVADEFDLGCC